MAGLGVGGRMSFVDGLHGGAVKTAAQDRVCSWGVVARLKACPSKAARVFSGGWDRSPTADVLNDIPMMEP